MNDRDLHRLLAPRSIAVVGGAPAEQVVRQCRLLGFDGAIWPVHPSRAELDGVPCFPSLDALPGVPDAVFLGVNRHATVAAMTQPCRRSDAGGAVCYGSGFAEAGEDGAALQRALVAAAGGDAVPRAELLRLREHVRRRRALARRARLPTTRPGRGDRRRRAATSG